MSLVLVVSPRLHSSSLHLSGPGKLSSINCHPFLLLLVDSCQWETFLENSNIPEESGLCMY